MQSTGKEEEREDAHSGPTPRGREDSAARTEDTVVHRSTSASMCRILGLIGESLTLNWAYEVEVDSGCYARWLLAWSVRIHQSSLSDVVLYKTYF